MTRRQLMLYAAVGGLLITGWGCQHEPPPAEPPERRTALVLDTPHNTVRQLIGLLDEHLDAIAAGDREAARDALDQVAWFVLDRENLLAKHQRELEVGVFNADQVLTGCVENWAAMLAYYIDGAEVTALDLSVNAEREQVITVPADVKGDTATIKVYCVPADGGYRVRRVTLGTADADEASTTDADAAP